MPILPRRRIDLVWWRLDRRPRFERHVAEPRGHKLLHVTTQPGARTFRSDIQGLRALAVAGVVLYHAGVPVVSGGYIGVDVFFVVSGFLITSHLLASLKEHGTVDLLGFYARRVRRIVPAAIVVIALSTAAALILMPPLLMREVWAGAVSAALYVPNIFFAIEGTNYLAEETPSLFQHYWSLGIEEQFYLLWPLFLIFLSRLFRAPRSLFIGSISVAVVSFAACVLLTFESQPLAFFLLLTRAWELLAGGLVAFLLLHRNALESATNAAWVGWIGIALIVVPMVLFNSTTVFPGPWALIPVLGTMMVIFSGATRARFSPTAALSIRALQRIGRLSYSIYLVHWPMLVIPRVVAGEQNPLPLWLTLTIALSAVPVAWLLYRFVERPMLAVTVSRRGGRRRILLSALGASAVCVAIATIALSYSSSLPLSAGQSAADTVLSSPPASSAYVPVNLAPALRSASSDQSAIYTNGCHKGYESIDPEGCLFGDDDSRRVVLFGDSHAAHWFPAMEIIAQRHGLAIDVRTKGGCPSVIAPILREGAPYGQCDTWRNGVLDDLVENPPSLVVLANSQNANLAVAEEERADLWEEGLVRTLNRIDVPVTVINDTPNLGSSPPICLSAHLEDALDCGRARDEAVDSSMTEAVTSASADHGATAIDVNDLLCNDAWCAPIVGNTLIYRDAHHLTMTMAEELAPAIEPEIMRLVGEQ